MHGGEIHNICDFRQRVLFVKKHFLGFFYSEGVYIVYYGFAVAALEFARYRRLVGVKEEAQLLDGYSLRKVLVDILLDLSYP